MTPQKITTRTLILIDVVFNKSRNSLIPIKHFHSVLAPTWYLDLSQHFKGNKLCVQGEIKIFDPYLGSSVTFFNNNKKSVMSYSAFKTCENWIVQNFYLIVTVTSCANTWKSGTKNLLWICCINTPLLDF